MEEDYIFIQGQDDTGVFIKASTVTSIRYDRAQGTAMIITADEESYIVVGALAVQRLHDYYYQRSPLKLIQDKQRK